MKKTADHLRALILLTLVPESDSGKSYLHELDEAHWPTLLDLAESHHVTIRAFEPLLRLPIADHVLRWIKPAVEAQHRRIEEILPLLDSICRACAERGHPLIVIKSLDHWPDFGDDADVYTNAKQKSVRAVLTKGFKATLKPRTLGDRLAQKQTYIIPGIKTHIEAHVQRLGQVGEQVAVAQRFIDCARPLTVNGYTFLIPADQERILAAALMRVYRHLHVRICDVLNTGQLIRQGMINFEELRDTAELGGIWSGVATYLSIVSDFYREFTGTALPLPSYVQRSALFGKERLSVKGKFMHVPMVPEASRLYMRQWTHAVRRGSVNTVIRLATVPPLVSASSLAHALLGRGLRIW